MLGFAGPNLPHDLLDATGRNMGPLGWNIDRPMPAAERWLESKFAPWTRSVIQDWADGVFDHLEAVIFSRADDSTQRLYYYLCELRRNGVIGGPEPLILDVAKIPRPSSFQRTQDGLHALAARLGVNTATLADAIVRGNAKRKAASLPASPSSQPVCLIAGSALPDDRMHKMVHQTGWQAHGRTLADEWTDPGPQVDETGDPFAALARHIHARPLDTRGFHDRAAALVEQARDIGARAALFWLIEEDDTSVWQLPGLRAALESEGLPVMVATRRDWSCRDGIDGELAAFLRGISE